MKRTRERAFRRTHRMRLICLLCVLVTAVSAAHPAAAAAKPLGDANGDGVITGADARRILRAAVELDRLSGERKTALDIDGDKMITAEDARLALRTAVGLEEPVLLPEIKEPRKSLSGVGKLKDGEYSYEMLEADLRKMRSAFPSRFSYSSLGKTADGRDIYCIVLGTGFGARQLVFDAAIHGSEHLTPPAVMRTLAYYLTNYDQPVYKNRTVRDILRDTDLYIFPMLNPDGVAISQYGLAGLKHKALRDQVRSIYEKNRAAGRTYDSRGTYLRVWTANANGVDLNRNFEFKKSKKKCDTGVYEPANSYYGGNRSLPEGETAAYCALVESLPNVKASVSFHQQGGMIYCNTKENTTPEQKTKIAMTHLLCKETGYWLNSSLGFLGASAEWMNIEKKIPAVTMECGVGHNPLPAEQLPKIASALKNVFLALAVFFET